MSPSKWFVLFCCWLVFVQVGDAIKGRKKESYSAMSGLIDKIDEFGFKQSGTVSTTVENAVHLNNEQLGFFLCSQAQQKELEALTDVRATFCSSRSEESVFSERYNTTYQPWIPLKDVCEWNMANPLDDRLDEYGVYSTDLYTLSILSCYECSKGCSYQRITIDYVFINPGGNHLSTADWPLPKMYAYCALGWVVVCLVFVMAMAWNVFEEWYYTHPEHGNPDLAWMVESQTSSRSMHGTLLLAAATKGGVALMNALLYMELKSEGTESSWVMMMKNILFSVSECVIFAWLLLAGLGWCVVVREVDPDELQTLSSSLVALSLSLLFFSMYHSSEDMMSLVVMYIFLLPNIFSNIHNNVDGLRFHLTWLRGMFGRGEVNEDDRRALDWMIHALASKITFYRSLKALLTGYLVSILAVNVSVLFLPWWGEWLSSLGYELLLLGFVFRVFLIVWPTRWRDGLFWFQGEDDDDDAIHDWTDFGRRLFGLGGGWEAGAGRSSRGEEFIEKLREFDEAVSKKALLVQFPISDSKEGEKTAEEGEKNEPKEEEGVDEGEKEKKEEKEEEKMKERDEEGERKGKGEEEEEVFVHDEALSSSSSSSLNGSDVVINLSSPVRSLNQSKPYSQQLEEIEEPETPRNVYFAIPSSANRYLERVEEPERGHGGMDVGEDGEVRDDAVVLANLLREVGFY